MPDGADILIGIDSGTSVVKAVAFDLGGRQVAAAAVLNRYETGRTARRASRWSRPGPTACSALRGLGEKVENLARRTVAIAVTAQGDGTWLVGAGNAPVGDAWLWLDARAAPTVERLGAGRLERARFEATGTGLNTCQQGAQMAQMDRTAPGAARPRRGGAALQGLALPEPDRCAGDRPVGGELDLRQLPHPPLRRHGDRGARASRRRRGLLPEIVDGTEITHPLTDAAAATTGLAAGTPVSLGYVDMVMTALGRGRAHRRRDAACTIIGSTGVHMLAKRVEEVRLNAERTGYVMALPVPGDRHADADQHGGCAQHRLGAARRRRSDGRGPGTRSPSPTSSRGSSPGLRLRGRRR